jgi:hypothetical protein
MTQSLRQRIRATRIYCLPWRIWRGEIDLLPISAKCLFARRGMSIDIWERTLRSEGYLLPGEILLEVLKDPQRLNGRPFGGPQEVDHDHLGDFPDDWTEEDFRDYFESSAGP